MKIKAIVVQDKSLFGNSQGDALDLDKLED